MSLNLGIYVPFVAKRFLTIQGTQRALSVQPECAHGNPHEAAPDPSDLASRQCQVLGVGIFYCPPGLAGSAQHSNNTGLHSSGRTLDNKLPRSSSCKALSTQK